MNSGPTVDVVVEAHRAQVWLNRPDKLNPLGYETLVELRAAARRLDDMPAVKVVVFAGRGRAFSAGADLSRSSGDELDRAVSPREGGEAGRLMVEAVESMRAVTIAAIQGYCIGGAVLLATACDLRVAAVDATFSIPEVDLGIPLTWGGIPRLVRDLGPVVTKELVLTCRRFGAAEAKEIGFLNRVAAGSLEEEVDELVALLEQKSALTLQATKAHVNAVANSTVSAGLSWNDTDSLLTALADPESLAARRAYLERVRGTR